MTNSIALYPGTFDPVTNGHIDVIRRATQLFRKVIIGIGVQTGKETVFSVEERLKHLETVCSNIPGTEITAFEGLLTEAVKEHDAVAVVRGLRAVSDFEYEFQMALMNRELAPECETIFLMPSPEYSYISSTIIREIACFGGDITPFVPASIADELVERVKQ